MAINPIEFLRSASVDIANGSNTVTVNGSVDCSSVYAGTAVFINDTQAVEAISGTSFNPSTGVSTITLRYNWDKATVTAGTLIAFNTKEGLNSAVTRLNEIIKSVPDFPNVTGEGLLERLSNGTYSIRDISDASDVLSNLSVKIPKVSDVHVLLNSLNLANQTDVINKIQSFGLGTQTPTLVADLDKPGNTPTQFMSVASGTQNRPAGVQVGTLIKASRFTATTESELDGSMLLIGTTGSREELKFYVKFDFDRDATQSSWSEIYHTGNLSSLQNTSGSNINSNATVAGSNLTPAQTGTWRNVCGNDVANNGYGLFRRV